jgi:hypothetical protein
MGGGAGVEWEVQLERSHWKWNARKKCFRPIEEVKVDRFSARGYMDGMDDVRGDLLKVVSIEVTHPEMDLDWWKEHYDLKEDIFTMYFYKETCKHPHYMTWGGYIRSPIESIFPLTLEGEMVLEDQTYPVSVTVIPVDMEEFKYWYQDVFETHSTGLDEERKKIRDKIDDIEEMLEDETLSEDAQERLQAKIEDQQDELEELGTDEAWWDAHWESIQANYGAERIKESWMPF